MLTDCIFCKIAQGEAKSTKVYENEHVLAFFDVNPVNSYHTLIIPKRHYKDIFGIPESELIEITKGIKYIVDLYKTKVGINNLQIINSSGEEAQQDIFHIHFHIVPRHKGDGQDIVWEPNTELREEFEHLLKKLS